MMAGIHFKFRETVPSQDRQVLIDQLRHLGVATVHPLFPGERDPELALIYEVESSPVSSHHALDLLNNDPAVEYAEEPPRRRLVR